MYIAGGKQAGKGDGCHLEVDLTEAGNYLVVFELDTLKKAFPLVGRQICITSYGPANVEISDVTTEVPLVNAL